MKGKTALISLVILILSITSYAQQGNNRGRLKELSDIYDLKYKVLLDEARQYATSNSIPVREVLPGGYVKELQFIDNGRPVFFETQNIDAAFTTRTNELWIGGNLGLNLDGSGYSQLGLWDESGVRTSHDEFTNNGSARVIQQDKVKTIGDHSTHVAGTLVAGGVKNNSKGMAYNGTLKAWDWTRDVSEMVRAASKGLEISNHSYGFIHGWRDGQWYGDESVSTEEDYWFGFYSEYSRELDDIAYNAPYYLIVKSAGNDRDDVGNGTNPPDGNGGTGYDCVGTRAIAKNILTVGAVDDLGTYTGPSSVIMSEFSSWGPADDGRIKPDIVANGVNLYSPVGSGDSDYGIYFGTSMSTPNAAGSMALLQEHYQNTHGGTSMRSATLKALVIHTADEAGPDPGPDYMFGWGLMNVEKAALKISEDDDLSMNVIDELVIANNEIYTREITSDGSQALLVTIVWTDPSAIPTSPSLDPTNSMLVNDLDLSILGNTGTYYPWKLDMTVPSSAATNLAENNVDNVEKVFIATPQAGTYTIQVKHDGILESPQYYSMIISGISTTQALYCNSHGNALAEWIESFSIGTTVYSTGSSLQTGYQDRTSDIFYLDANTGYPISMTPGFDPRSKFEYWAVWIDYNNDNVFDDPGERVFSASKSKTALNGTIDIPDIGEVETRMRVSMSRSGIPGPCDIIEYGEVEDYTIQIGGGPPDLLTADFVADQTSISPGESVQFTDLTSNGPTSWSWTFEGGSPAVSDLQSPIVSYETDGVYSVTLVASNGVETDEEIKLGYISVSDEAVEYCSSDGLRINQEWIASVSIENVFSNTTGASHYSYFPEIDINLNENESYNFILTPDFPRKVLGEYWKVWIDYNGNGSFDPSELVFEADNQTSTVSGSFTVPPVSSKTTRMRVSMSRTEIASPCGQFTRGEVEDYLLTLSGSPSGANNKSGYIISENNISQSQLGIYPNPGNKWISIEYKGELDNANLKIYTVQGALMINRKINSSHTTLDISKLEPGIYHLALNTGDKIIYGKIVKR